jgi:alpha-beta hydrolase superfamily lysophospholipase
MLPETNRGESTYDGIDWGGERVATEVSESIYVDDCFNDLVQIFQEVEKLRNKGKRVTRFSITGHSMGGLLARYVIGCVTSFCTVLIT